MAIQSLRMNSKADHAVNSQFDKKGQKQVVIKWEFPEHQQSKTESGNISNQSGGYGPANSNQNKSKTDKQPRKTRGKTTELDG